MRTLIIISVMLFLVVPAGTYAQEINWNVVIDTESEHNFHIKETNHEHFTKQWRTTDSWSDSEGYMRWTIAYTQEEDDDGYVLDHPNTTGDVYLSYIARTGSTWQNNHVGGEWKQIMFYNTTSTNPRPTVFSKKICSTPQYGILYMSNAAGGAGIQDEFGNDPEGFETECGNHTYQEVVNVAADQWYFFVFKVSSTGVSSWIWSQDGTLDGSLYAQSDTTTFSETWSMVLFLAYIEATTAGDSNSFMDVAHISVHQTLPSAPPDGFLESSTPANAIQGGTISGGHIR